MLAVAKLLQRVLEAVTITLLVALAIVVLSAVTARYVFNASFVWYDEVASILLAWLTFYGAALAALRRRHLGFPGLLLALPVPTRFLLFLVGEILVLGAFAAIGYGGWFILRVMGADTMISLDVPLAVTQSVVPIGAGLFVVANLLSAPAAWAGLRSGRSSEDEEIAEELARAGQQRTHGAAADPVETDRP